MMLVARAGVAAEVSGGILIPRKGVRRRDGPALVRPSVLDLKFASFLVRSPSELQIQEAH